MPWPDEAMPLPLQRPPAWSALGLAAGYGAAAAMSLYLGRQPGTIATVWFANSLVVAYLAFRPPRQWPLPLALVALATVLLNVAWGDGWAHALAFVPTNLAEMALGGWLLRRHGVVRSALRSAGALLRLWLLGGVLPQLASATVGALLFTALGAGAPGTPWLQLVQGSLIGAVSVLPAAFLFFRHGGAVLARAFADWRFLTLLPLSLGIVLLCLAHVPFPFVYLGLPLLLAAMTVDTASVTLLTVAVSVVVALALATGVFVPPPAASDAETAFLYLAYATALVPAQLLAAAVAELRDSRDRLEHRSAALRRSNEALEQFVRIASHDLREPLNTVIQFGGLLDQDHARELSEPGPRYLALMRGAALRMRQLLDDVMQYARVQGGEIPAREAVALDAVMADVRAAVAARLHQGGGQLRTGPLPVVSGHAGLLSLLLQNLVANALKFVPPGRRAEVDVSARVDADHAWVTVTDNGIGIASSDLPKLFRPFQRLNRRTQFEGTGLGLAICRQIVQAHGGDIHVASVPGEGSRFTVRLPLRG
jgi:signal transduction histidine kinase